LSIERPESIDRSLAEPSELTEGSTTESPISPLDTHRRENDLCLAPRWAICIFLGALALRAVVLIDHAANDPWFLTPVAEERTLVEVGVPREGNRVQDGNSISPSPLYSTLLTGATSLFGSPWNPEEAAAFAWWTKSLQAVLDSVTAVLIASIALRLGGLRVALAAGSIYAIGFLPVFYCVHWLAVTLYTFSIVLLARVTTIAAASRHPRAWFLTGVILGLATLTQATALAALAPLSYFACRAGISRRLIVRSCLAMLAGLALTITPALISNSPSEGNQWHPLQDSVTRFLLAHRSGEGLGFDGLSTATDHLMTTRSLEVDVAKITPPGHGFSWQVGAQLLALVHSFDVPRERNFRLERERLVSLRHWPGRSGVVIPLLLTGLIYSGILLGNRAVLCSLLAVQALIALCFVVNAQERAPLLALGAVPAGAALSAIFDRQFSKRIRCGLLGLVLGLFLLLQIDPLRWNERYADFVQDPVALGQTLEEQGKIEEARQYYERGTRLKWTEAAAEHRLGLLTIAAAASAGSQGEVERASKLQSEAIEHFERALAIDPHFARSWNSLGLIQLASNNYEAAAQAFEKAIASDPYDASPRSHYGQLLESAGHFAKARPLFEAARRLEPDVPLYWLLEAHLLWKMYQPRYARTLLAQLDEKIDLFDLAPNELKLRSIVYEDLEIWPDGPPPDHLPPDETESSPSDH